MASSTHFDDAQPSDRGAPGPCLNRKPTTIDLIGGIFCNICEHTYSNKTKYDVHYKLHNTGRSEIEYTCVVCRLVVVHYRHFLVHCYRRHVHKDKFSSTSHRPTKPTIIDLIGGIICHICKLTFSNKKEYDKHYTTHNTGGAEIEYECVVCHKVLAGFISFRNHCSDRHVQRDKFKCKYCDKTFVKQLFLYKHVIAVHMPKYNIDNVTKRRPHTFLDHGEEGSSGKPTTIDLVGGILCNICKTKFSNKKGYDEHYATHNTGGAEVEYACVVCRTVLAGYISFWNHCYERHVRKEKIRPQHTTLDQTEENRPSTNLKLTTIDLIGGIFCRICEMTFSNKKEYDEHYATHKAWSADMEYACVLCHKVISDYRNFRQHCDRHLQKEKFRRPLSHLGQTEANNPSAPEPQKTRKPTTIDLVGGILCNICQLTFGNKKEYDEHYATHDTGGAEIEYACIICHKVIVDYLTFRRHCYDSHLKKDKLSSQRPKAKHTIDLIGGIFCKVCQLTFSNKIEYDEHYATHNTDSAEIKYACVVCHKAVAGYTSFRRHCYDQHLQIAKFGCKFCDKTFMKQMYLDKHIIRRHAFNNTEGNSADTPPHSHLEQAEANDCAATGPPKTRKPTTIDLVGGILCNICQLTFGNKKEYDKHYATHDTAGAEIEYACVVCHKSLTGYKSFHTHCYDQHVQKDKFKCKHCDKTFIKQSILKEHITAMHVYKCTKDNCTKQFTSEKDLHVHEFIHKKERIKPPYQCQTCYDQIDGIDACEEHIDQHCTFSYSCPICNENITKTNATVHLMKHFGEVLNEDSTGCELPEISEDSSINVIGGIFCCYCDNIYKNRLEYDVHFTAEHEDKAKVYCCIICKKKIETYSKFGCHCYDHISKARFECDECDKSFPRLSLVVQHTEAHHAGAGGARRTFRCAQCPRAYSSTKRLVAHARAAHEILHHACTEPGCDTTFETPKDLILHQKQHKSTLDTWCRQCGLQFTTLASCEKHLDVHKEKLFSCPVCGRQYGEKYLMMNHISQHFESVLHMCKVCGKIYDAKRRLIEHVKTHCSAKMYECEYCGKGFVKTNHLQQHLSIHTGMKPFKCLACPKTFGSYPNWHKHMRKMHNIDTKMLKKSANNSPNSNENSPFIMIQPGSVTSESTGTPMSAMEQDYDMADTDDSTMDSESIDNIVIEKESPIFDTDMNPVDMAAALANELPDNIFAFVTEAQEAMAEAPPPPPPAPPSPPPPAAHPVPAADLDPGPEFSEDEDLDLGIGELIDLDDHLIPDIDPRLITSPAYAQHLHNYNFHYDNYEQNMIERSKWEPPVITKFYENFYGDKADMGATRVPVMNTNIF